MKKIGLLTYYNVHNYGAMLQMYSLVKLFESMNAETVILRFDRNYRNNKVQSGLKYNISLKSMPYYICNIPKIGVRKFLFNSAKYLSLLNFKHRYINVGDYYYKYDKLDAICIGSDEVFSIDVGINSMMYGNELNCSNVYTYAASFGPSSYEDIINSKSEDIITEGIKNIKNLSARDNNTKEIIMKLTVRNALIVCDPVILYSFIMEKEKSERKIHCRYLLVYSYDNNMNTPGKVNTIIEFARKNKLKIVSVGFYHKWCDINLVSSPIDMISIFKFAEYVITDTFHGSVISLITNKNFCVTKDSSIKINDLLESVNLEDRCDNDINKALEILEHDIDYKIVNITLEKQRQISQEYLELCIEGKSRDEEI